MDGMLADKPVDAAVTAITAAVEGEDLTLECGATSTSLPRDHNLALQVQWFDSAGTLVTGGQDKVEDQGTRLVVRSIQRHDNGLKFLCRASDGLDMWSEQSQPYTIVPECELSWFVYLSVCTAVCVWGGGEAVHSLISLL